MPARVVGGLTRLATAAAFAALAAATVSAPRAQPPRPADAATSPSITFFVIGDPQINIPRWGVAGTERTIDLMNRLPGEPHPLGGIVEEPRGVLVLGDLQDDLRNPDNWSLYKQLFDVNGRGARLRFPVFEGIGNHDLTSSRTADGLSPVQRAFIERNRRREGTRCDYDEAFYHYSWDWGPLHLVQLNLFPGSQPRPVYDREAPWNDPRGSLDFLRRDLRERVGASGRPVILMWHYGLRGWGLEKWWTEEDLAALRDAIRPYNVVLILHGHEHAYARYRWEGYDVIMAPAPQIDRDPDRPEEPSRPKGFLVVRLIGSTLQVAHRTAEGWRETWAKSIDLGSPGAQAPVPAAAGGRH